MKSSCSPRRLSSCQKPGEPLSACLILLSRSLFSSLHPSLYPFPKVRLPHQCPPHPANHSLFISRYTMAKTLIRHSFVSLCPIPRSLTNRPHSPLSYWSLSISTRHCKTSRTSPSFDLSSVFAKFKGNPLDDQSESRRFAITFKGGKAWHSKLPSTAETEGNVRNDMQQKQFYKLALSNTGKANVSF